MRTTYSKYSSITGSESDLVALDAQIETARANYEKFRADYIWGLSNGSTKYAENTRKPRMESAEEILNKLKAQRKQLLENLGIEQNIDIVKKISNDTTGENAKSGLPWATIGLAVGALVVIVIIVKVL